MNPFKHAQYNDRSSVQAQGYQFVKNGFFKNREFDFGDDLTGIPYQWYFRAKSTETVHTVCVRVFLCVLGIGLFPIQAGPGICAFKVFL